MERRRTPVHELEKLPGCGLDCLFPGPAVHGDLREEGELKLLPGLDHAFPPELRVSKALRNESSEARISASAAPFLETGPDS